MKLIHKAAGSLQKTGSDRLSDTAAAYGSHRRKTDAAQSRKTCRRLPPSPPSAVARPSGRAAKKGTGTGHLFVKNAAILTVTSLLLRGIGMYFRIWVSAQVGAEGMGLYQLIMSVYMLAAGFASSGITVAVTRMTADELACGTRASVRGVLRRCVTLSLAMGLLSVTVLELLAEPIGSGWLSDGRSVSSVRIMALALPFMSVSCCLRGYFTARRRAGVPSAAQITEQLSRIALAVWLLKLWMPGGVEWACIAIMTADVISEGAGCLYVIVAYFLDRRRQTDAGSSPCVAHRDMGRAIWNITAPITASHYLTTLLRTIESILVPDCLTRSELSRERALELFGLVKGMALPLVLFPSTLLTAFSSLLTPEISQAKVTGRGDAVDKAVRRAMRITFSLAVPVSGLFLLFPHELGVMVYSDDRLGPILMSLAPLMPLMYAESVAVGILRGLGEQNCSLVYGIADSVMRILLIILLVPRMGMPGFLTVMAASNLLTPILHLRRLTRVSGHAFEWGKWIIEPMTALLPALLCGWLLNRLPMVQALPQVVRMGGVGAVICLMYAGALWLLDGARSPRQLSRSLLPSGARM